MVVDGQKMALLYIKTQPKTWFIADIEAHGCHAHVPTRKAMRAILAYM